MNSYLLKRYAREIGPKIQAFFEDYFQIPFPLPKQDMIAIPDFAAGIFIFPVSHLKNCFFDFSSFIEFRCHGKLGVNYLQV